MWRSNGIDEEQVQSKVERRSKNYHCQCLLGIMSVSSFMGSGDSRTLTPGVRYCNQRKRGDPGRTARRDFCTARLAASGFSRRVVAELHLEEHWFSGPESLAVIHELRRRSMGSQNGMAIRSSFFLFFGPGLPRSAF
jgi:hypothetical protein